MIYLIIGYFVSNAALLLILANELFKSNKKIAKMSVGEVSINKDDSSKFDIKAGKAYIGAEDSLANLDLNNPIVTRYSHLKGS